MPKNIEQRLKELRTELEAGQKMMADLESKQANLRDTLLRISGAIQVLEELIESESGIGELQEEEEEEEADQNPEVLAGQKTEMEMVAEE